MILNGIDISHHNTRYVSNHDIKKMAQDGFVIMKATEGITYKDPMLDTYYNIIHGADDGRPDDTIQYGFYHYAHPETNDVDSELENFLNRVKHHAGHCIYALDIEGKALTVPDLDQWVYNWCMGVLARTGVKPLVYCQKSALKLLPLTASAGFGLWLAAPSNKTKPTTYKPWSLMAIWQCDWIDVDKDIFYGSKEQWRKYCKRRI